MHILIVHKGTLNFMPNPTTATDAITANAGRKSLCTLYRTASAVDHDELPRHIAGGLG